MPMGVAKSQEILRKNNVTVAGNLQAARTLVFVHGFGTDQTAWDAVTPAFATDWRIVLLDNVGAGGSDPAAFVESRYHDLEKYADDLLDIADVLELKQAVLVGHSVGGMVGILAANRAPEVFAKLVLIGVSPRYLQDTDYPGNMSNTDVRDVYEAIRNDHLEWAMNYSLLALQNPDRPELSEGFAKTLQKIPAERVLTVLHSILQMDFRSELPRLSIPTLIIQSLEDAFVPLAVAEYMHKAIIGSRLQVIDAYGHLPHISAPAAVTAAMQDFLKP